METLNLNVNHLPAPTWNRLEMNQLNIDFDIDKGSDADYELTEAFGLDVSWLDSPEIKPEKTALGKDMDDLITRSGVKTLQITCPKDLKKGSPARISYMFPEENTVNSLEIKVENGSSLTLIADLSSAAGAGSSALQTRYLVEDEADLTIVQIQRTGKDFTLLNDIGGTVLRSGRVHLIEIILEGKRTVHGFRADLSGDGSRMEADLGYLSPEGSFLDMNYIADHTGKDTLSRINAGGVLYEDAYKLFRGTIDFHRGCSGSKGSENEEVLLMDDDVVNKTIPLILCDEEDVEGDHGATIGRLDQDILF